MAPLQDGQTSRSVPHPPIHPCNASDFLKKVTCVLIKTDGNPYSLQYVLKTMFEFDWGWCKFSFILRFSGIHEPEKIRLCLLMKTCCICFDYLVGSRWTYFRPQFTQCRRKNCVFHMMNTVQMFRILSKPLGGKVTGTSECLLCTFWRMPLEKFNSNQITIWHVYSFSTVVFSSREPLL